jgi:hypothetical protein
VDGAREARAATGRRAAHRPLPRLRWLLRDPRLVTDREGRDAGCRRRARRCSRQSRASWAAADRRRRTSG